jgi:uncharacterized protein YcfJ
MKKSIFRSYNIKENKMIYKSNNYCKLSHVIFLSIILTSCTGAGAKYRPVVDPSNNDMTLFEQDLKECQNIAEEESVAKEAGKGTVLGAAVGATIGAITGAITGDVGSGVALGTGLGGVSGGVQGGAAGVGDQEIIIKNCMIGRGYRVLK